MDIKISDFNLNEFANYIDTMFRTQIEEKKLQFKVKVDEKTPVTIKTDGDRVQQVVRNFISNSMKFTENGEISLIVHPVDKRTAANVASCWILNEDIKRHPEHYVAFSVNDTGIGISKENQTIIFEAFQQVDGTIRRKYGGTGLGLSICRGIADVLNGAIALRSVVNKGSTFSLILPIIQIKRDDDDGKSDIEKRTAKIDYKSRVDESDVLIPDLHLNDDREIIHSDKEKIILIVEDDIKFASILKDIAYEHKYKVLHATTGTEAIRLANEFIPLGVMLDIKLPIMNGWEVLRQLKHNSATRHIPVHILSVEPDENFGYKLGAIGYLVKPIEKEQLEEAFARIETLHKKKVKNLLVVEDNEVEREAIVKLLADKDVQVDAVATGKEALSQLQINKYGSVVLDLRLPDMDGFEVLKKMNESEVISKIPTIVYTAKDLTIEEEKQLRKYSESIILKTADSHERLLEETSIFLHRIEAGMNKQKRDMLAKITSPEATFKNRTVLLVDDDVRNTYTLTTAFENKGLNVVSVSDGEEALKMLDQHDNIDIILMDIMMPVMDGYETIKRIREQEKYKDIPIIAVTAKAMKEDREKSIAAGASDYISKPIDQDQLFSLIRIWLAAIKEKLALESGA